MKKGSLFFIGLTSAIITVISLNVAVGRTGYYNDRYPYYNHNHYCDDRYNRLHNDRNDRNQRKQKDSSNSNY